MSVTKGTCMAVHSPSLLQWNRPLDVVEELHEQALLHYFEDNGVSHHTDLSILCAGDERQVRFHQGLLGRQRYPFPFRINNKDLTSQISD